MRSNEGHDRSFDPIGTFAVGLMHEITAKAAGVDPLKGHPGRSPSIFKYGLPRLQAHAATLGLDYSELEKTVEEQMRKGEALCESPIERNILAALLTGAWPTCLTGHPVVHNAKNYSEELPRCAVVIVPQMALLRYRLDIGILAIAANGAPTMFGVECDGKQFHQDYEKDRQRDAYFAGLGVNVTRVSGRIANEAPIAVGDAIINKISGLLK
jgi:hypothetical protein